MHNTITLDQANKEIDRHLNSIPHALAATAALDTKDRSALHQPDMPCTDDTSKYLESLRYGQRSYPVVGLDVHNLTPIFAAFHQWAQHHGFTVDAANERRPGNPTSRATNKDGYKASLDVEYGRLFLSVSSPCVWRHGNPEPS